MAKLLDAVVYQKTSPIMFSNNLAFLRLPPSAINCWCLCNSVWRVRFVHCCLASLPIFSSSDVMLHQRQQWRRNLINFKQ